MDESAASKARNEKLYRMAFGGVYPLYLRKVERKGRSRAELDEVIRWLTGYNQEELERRVEDGCDFKTFFEEAPRMNPNASKITGMICGIRVEEIEDKVVRQVRYLDKLVDELAKGRPMDKILRA